MYKVDMEKGFKILTAVYPNLVFINGPRFSLQVFTEKFRGADANLLTLESIFVRFTGKFNMTKGAIAEYFSAPMGDKPDLENALVHELHSYMDRFRTSPCIISGSLGNIALIQRIFDEDHAIFTYVYVYPNSSDTYRESILAIAGSYDVTDVNDPFVAAILKDREAPAVKDAPKKSKSSKSLPQKDAKAVINNVNIDVYIKSLLDGRKKIFKTHTEALGRALVILV